MEEKIKIRLKILFRDRYGKYIVPDYLMPFDESDEFEFIISEKPDFIIGAQSANSDYFQYDCVRISVDLERYTPDFNIWDYAVSDDVMEYGDRHFTRPYIAYPFCRQYIHELRGQKLDRTLESIRKKDKFCNFIYSNGVSDGMRDTLFFKLSEYKKVHSGGGLHNNIGYRIGGGIGDYQEKLDFQASSKFTLAVENVSFPGYVSEKILHGFVSGTVPIYCGDSGIEKYFNKKAFINYHDFNDLDKLLERVKEIDQNDELYLEMLNQPKLNPDFDYEKNDLEYKEFLRSIFIRQPEHAKRRSTVLYAAFHELDLKKGKIARDRKREIEDVLFHFIKTKLGIRAPKLMQLYRKKMYYR